MSCTARKPVANGVPGAQMIKACGPAALMRVTCAVAVTSLPL